VPRSARPSEPGPAAMDADTTATSTPGHRVTSPACDLRKLVRRSGPLTVRRGKQRLAGRRRVGTRPRRGTDPSRTSAGQRAGHARGPCQAFRPGFGRPVDAADDSDPRFARSWARPTTSRRTTSSRLGSRRPPGHLFARLHALLRRHRKVPFPHGTTFRQRLEPLRAYALGPRRLNPNLDGRFVEVMPI